MAGLNKRSRSIIQLKPRNPTTSIKGKLPIQAVCDFKQQEVGLFPLWKCLIIHHCNHDCHRSWDYIYFNISWLLFRSLSTKEMSVHSSTTLSPSSGRSWTVLDTRQWCLLSASLYLLSTRRLWTVCPGVAIKLIPYVTTTSWLDHVNYLICFFFCSHNAQYCPTVVWMQVIREWCPCGRCSI